MVEEISNLKDQLTEHLIIVDAEKEELESIKDITCTLETEQYSADYSLGLVPSLTLKMCNDYKKFSTRTNSRIREMCQVLKDNNFWIDKQNEATAEQEEFKRTLRETLTNRSAFSSSEEDRLRNQLEIEETKLAFLMEQISEAEKAHTPSAKSVTEHAPKVTLASDVPRKPPLSPFKQFHSPAKVAISDRTSISAGATTHSRAFSPPPAVSPSPTAKTVSPVVTRLLSKDPFEGWADRSGSSPRQVQAETQSSEDRPSRAETEDQHTSHSTQNSMEEADIELDCTVAAQNKSQRQNQLGSEVELRVLGDNNNSSLVEVTTVRTTITEVRRAQKHFCIAHHHSMSAPFIAGIRAARVTALQ